MGTNNDKELDLHADMFNIGWFNNHLQLLINKKKTTISNILLSILYQKHIILTFMTCARDWLTMPVRANYFNKVFT